MADKPKDDVYVEEGELRKMRDKRSRFKPASIIKDDGKYPQKCRNY